MEKKTKPLASKIKLGIATTMKAAAAKTGLSSAIVKSAQDSGCPAFKANGRIDCDVLVDYLAKQPESDSAPDYHLEKALSMRAERKIKEEKLLLMQRAVYPRDDVIRTLRTHIIASKTKLNAGGGELSAQAKMRLNLTNDQTAEILKIYTDIARRVQHELYTQNFGQITCPLCKGEIKNEK